VLPGLRLPALLQGGGPRRGRACLLLVSALFLSASGHAAEPSEAEVDAGREVYGEFCAACHGPDMINPGALTFDLRKFPKEQYERFRDAVLDGKPPAMPPWRGKLTHEDIRLLWVYVRSGG
jgi:cytochrome c55X